MYGRISVVGLKSPSSKARAFHALGTGCLRSTIYTQHVREEVMIGLSSIVGKVQVHISVRCMTDMAAAGPEFFSPVPELLREWCFLGRYVDICGISMLGSTMTCYLMYYVAH
jgi:hypothetical protein